MICPNCGENNPEAAPECARCQYKFSFAHALNDPSHMMLWHWGKQKKWWNLIMGAAFLVALLLPLLGLAKRP